MHVEGSHSTHEEGRLAGAQEVELFWQAWLPEQPKAVVVISHGVSEHSSRYAHVGERFAAAGYAVYALDHRGHGRSQGHRAMIERADYVVEDLHGLVRMARTRHPERKAYLLGHSMGGAVALAYTVRHQDELAGLILSGPLAALDAASPVTRAASRLLSVLTPRLGIYDVDSSAVSRDPQVVRDYEQDPLNYHGKLPARTVSEMTRAVERFPDQVQGLTLPLLVMHGSADTLTPVDGSRMVHARAGSRDKALDVLEGLYHEILNEPEREDVMSRMIGWLDERA
jgi:alpha-beta hydrolase superfamily lysophospholipase